MRISFRTATPESDIAQGNNPAAYSAEIYITSGYPVSTPFITILSPHVSVSRVNGFHDNDSVLYSSSLYP